MNTLVEVIKHNQSIPQLCVSSRANTSTLFDLDIVKRLINEHPELVTLDLYNCVLTVDGAIALIHQLHSLKTFHFLMQATKCRQFSLQLKDDFECVIIILIL